MVSPVVLHLSACGGSDTPYNDSADMFNDVAFIWLGEEFDVNKAVFTLIIGLFIGELKTESENKANDLLAQYHMNHALLMKLKIYS